MVIENVESLGSERQSDALGQLEILVDADVRVEEPGPAILVTDLVRGPDRGTGKSRRS